MVRNPVFARSIAVSLLCCLSLMPLAADAGLKEGLDKAREAAQTGKLKLDASAVQIVQNVINFLLTLMGVIAVLFLVIAGIMYITSFGDDTKAARAKKMILYVIIGLALIILSAAIVNTVLTLAQ